MCVLWGWGVSSCLEAEQDISTCPRCHHRAPIHAPVAAIRV